MGPNPQRGPSVDWGVLTTANASGPNGLIYIPKQGRARDNKFLVIHPMTDQHCLTEAHLVRGHHAPQYIQYMTHDT
jgi:hypothetical protein